MSSIAGGRRARKTFWIHPLLAVRRSLREGDPLQSAQEQHRALVGAQARERLPHEIPLLHRAGRLGRDNPVNAVQRDPGDAATAQAVGGEVGGDAVEPRLELQPRTGASERTIRAHKGLLREIERHLAVTG